MPRFGFTKEQMDQWKDQPVILSGDKKVTIILVHGWTAIPRQLMPLAETLKEKGFTVSIPLLKGHGTVPEDMENVIWQDWVDDVEREIIRIRQLQPENKIILAGASMGGNIALMVSLKTQVDGIILIGTPVHLRTHFGIWLSTVLLSPFNAYLKKRYPKRVAKQKSRLKATSYQYFPVRSVRETLDLIHASVKALPQITTPALILQTNSDYLVAKYSPWVIYNSLGSKYKKIQWLVCENGSHIMISKDNQEFISAIDSFIADVEEM